eukprot:TRINITY_DN8243_c0_g1_i1.p1 TRINITY_DN8243_c0_g1~~TRINITY_DN8243_c0_g1_i1.p1  ORF type:complete len:767 (-),score=243.23 TRINITY_DN8243_c0_g1_i1:543-2843(-)
MNRSNRKSVAPESNNRKSLSDSNRKSLMEGHKRNSSISSNASSSLSNSVVSFSFPDFSNPNFDSERYTNESYSIHVVERMKEMNALLIEKRDVAATELKTNVYRHYPKFINASKEISHLEEEMLELRNLLTENNSIMKGLQGYSVIIKQPEGLTKPLVTKLSSESEKMKNNMDWVLDLPEKLDVTISLRQFDNAVDLIEQVTVLMQNDEKLNLVVSANNNLRSEVDSRMQKLIAILLSDLSNGMNKSSESRRLIALLLRLGMPDRARETYLETRSKQIEREIKKMQLEGDLTLYISELARLVFSSINTTCEDFRASFQEPEMISGFVVWVIGELEKFGIVFRNQVLNQTDDYSTMGKCLEIATMHCSLLESKGLSLSFILTQMFYPNLINTIEKYYRKIEENLEKQVGLEKWIASTWKEESKVESKVKMGMTRPNSNPLTPRKPKENFGIKKVSSTPDAKQERKLGTKSSGKKEEKEKKKEEKVIQLTDSAKYLYNSSQNFVEDILKVVTLELMPSLTYIFSNMFEGYFKQLTLQFNPKGSSLTDGQSVAILANCFNINDDLVPRLLTFVEEKLERSLTEFEKLRNNLRMEELLIQKSFCLKKADSIVKSQIDWYGSSRFAAATIETGAVPSLKFVQMFISLSTIKTTIINTVGIKPASLIITTILENIVQKLNDSDFWENVDIGEGGLQQLVLDMKFFAEASGDLFQESSKQIVNDIIDTATLTYCKQADIDALEGEDALKPDDWFNTRIRATMVKYRNDIKLNS